jgi:hypothetical protein
MSSLPLSVHAVELNPARELPLLRAWFTALLQMVAVVRTRVHRKPKPRRHATYLELGTMAREMYRL